MADIDLAAIVGRAVRHQQDFGAALAQGLADAEIAPDVLAHRNAEAHAADRHRSGHLAHVEDALLVELAVIGQIHLVAAGNQLAAIEHGGRVEALAVLRARIADDHRRAAVGCVRRQRFHSLQAGFQEGRLQHQILRRIAGDEQLGEQHQIRAVARSVGPGLARPGEIAGNVAHRRVELRDGDADGVGPGAIGLGCLGLGHEFGVTPTLSA